MKRIPQLSLILTTHLVSMAISALIILADLRLALSASQVESLSQTLTMVLLVLGLAAYFKARFRPVHPGLIVPLGAVPPLVAYISGPLNHVLQYHFVALFAHALVLWRSVKRDELEAMKQNQGPVETDQTPPDTGKNSGQDDQ